MAEREQTNPTDIGNIDDLQAGQTLSIKRQELLSQAIEDLDEKEKIMAEFLKVLAEDLHIAGVALSRLKYGGVYTDFFVIDFRNKEAMRKTLKTAGASFKLLEQAADDNAGYGSYINLGGRTFEEAEKRYRERWNIGDPNNPFELLPRSEEMELIGIVEFV